MSLRLNRASLLLVLFLAGDAWALGLGEIRLSSALNEPLRAEIQLLSATPEELAGLRVELASAATFERYGIDRPHFLTRLNFRVVDSNQPGGDIVRITSDAPIAEPFVTFLIEASWPGGRLLREYTVLLDPPTFAPPPTAEAPQAVTAPQRQQQADSGRIERPAAPAPAPRQPAAEAFDTSPGGDVRVQRGDTLWQIATRVRPDSRLSMNQVMLAIYEANPQAFAGNVNRLTAGATLRIPSADDIVRINRADAMSVVRRHNTDFGITDAGRAQPSLTLVPPDGDQPQYADGADGSAAPAGAPGPESEARIRELERMVEDQRSLIEIRDSELASLREELARLRAEAAAAGGEEAAAPADEPVPADEVVEDTDQVFADDEATPAPADEVADEDAEAAPAPADAQPAPTVAATPPEPGLVDRVIGILTGFWGILGVVLLLVIGILLWLAKRAAGSSEEDSTGVWETLDDEEMDSESRASTERLRALARDDDSAIVVVEQESSPDSRRAGDTRELPGADADAAAETGVQPTLEDTFSSETAINLDQSDPIAEADFHMAYGLYDQAADLVNGALAAEPERQDLMAKLCEIYFVWGNKDAFVEAAGRLHDQLGGEATPDWDKIVIMGQQIAPDHRLFSGASAGAAGRAVDLAFEGDAEDQALDMDFGSGPDSEVSDVVDLGGEEEGSADYSGLDFTFDEEEADTGASTTREMPGRGDGDDETVESPTVESEMPDETVESPTIERPLDSVESTSEMPSLADGGGDAQRSSGDATAEIDLDDLGLDLESLAESGLADMDEESSSDDWTDADATSEQRTLQSDLDQTGRNFLDDSASDETAETGIMEEPDADDTLDATSEMPSMDEETGRNPAVPEQEEYRQTDVDLDSPLLDATGQTQVLTGEQDRVANDDNAETLLAPMDSDEETHESTAGLNPDDLDFDFARTEALSEDSYRGGEDDETAEVPTAGGADVDLDLDDLETALRQTEGDTVDQPRDEETVEQPRGASDDALDLDLGDLGGEEDAETQALSPDDMSDDLHNARTMTEVGTKLDLARAYVDMGDPDGARSILEEVIDEGDEGQRQQAQKLLETLPA